MPASMECYECNGIKRCTMHESRECGAHVGADKKGRQKYCGHAFTALSGGVQGCPVHGIRQGRMIYLCRPCARSLGYGLEMAK
jgi:hypothetical protein